LFVAGAGRPQLVKAQPPRHDGQPGADVIDLCRVGARKSKESLLRDVFGLPDVAQHLIGEVHQVRTVAAPRHFDRR